MTHSDYIKLVSKVKEYDYYYFELNAPMITDEEYDRLYFQLQDYEQNHSNEILPDSPTQTAHAEVKNGHKQIVRRTPMLSTEKVQSVDALTKWFKRTAKKLNPNTRFSMEWKYDGVSCSLVYCDGMLVEASYGKGSEGNDILSHCYAIPSIPGIINDDSKSGRIEVRGEIVMPFANLDKTEYKNCRSAAAGILANAMSEDDCKLLEFHPYTLTHDNGFISQKETLEYFGMKGFIRSYLNPTKYADPFVTLENVADQIEKMTEIRSSLSFPTDGIVIKVDDTTQWESLGATAHHPKYSIAYKFKAETAETTITRIEITTGKTGKRTPVAYFEPVVINGATYQKASVGSEAKLAELGIEVGSKVVISLRNDVIPHIERVTSPNPSQGGGQDNTPEPYEDDSNNPFIGNSESGENSDIIYIDEDSNTQHPTPTTQHPSAIKTFVKQVGHKFLCFAVGLTAIAAVASIAYCFVGLVFLLPLVMAKR